jgi:hypothetical protein
VVHCVIAFIVTSLLMAFTPVTALLIQQTAGALSAVVTAGKCGWFYWNFYCANEPDCPALDGTADLLNSRLHACLKVEFNSGLVVHFVNSHSASGTDRFTATEPASARRRTRSAALDPAQPEMRLTQSRRSKFLIAGGGTGRIVLIRAHVVCRTNVLHRASHTRP